MLILVMVAGLPLRYNLEESTQRSMDDVTSITLDALSSNTSLSSLPFTIFMASLYIFSIAILLRKPQMTFSLLRRQWPLMAILSMVGISMLWSYNQQKVLLIFVHTGGEMVIALAAALRYRDNPWLLPRHLGYVMGLNIMLQVGSVIAIPSLAIDWYGRWTGLTTQANTLGVIGLFAFWANMSVVICKKTPDKCHIHLILAVLSAIAMIGADSVTSMLCSVFVLALIYMLSRFDSAGRIKPRLYVVSAAIILLTVTAAVLVITNSIDLNKLFGLAGRSGDFTGRTEIWMDGAKAVSQRPLIGWSFDDNAYVIKMSGMAYTSYHNGYLDLAVRGGAIAVTLFFLLIATWAKDLRTLSRLGYELIPVSVPFVIAMLLHNMTEAWIVGPRNQIWTVFMALVFLGACKRRPSVQVGWAEQQQPFYGQRTLV